ncbi:MAG: hypothetical protein IPM94_04955 [bacterium]|nr:hypothetical protein [bacterium]
MSQRVQRRPAAVRALCGAVLLCLAAAPAAALDDARLAILEVRLDGGVLSPGLPAYLDDGGGVLLPLGALSDLLEFAIDVEPARGRATGWLIEESRTFTLNLATGEVASDGQARALGAGEAVRGDDDIYVAPARLAEWLPCDIEVRTSQLVALLTSRETLPVQKRRLREDARSQRLMSKVAARAVHPVQKAEYQMFTWPLLDANVEYRGRSGDMAPVFSLQSAGDLARWRPASWWPTSTASASWAWRGPGRAAATSTANCWAPCTPRSSSSATSTRRARPWCCAASSAAASRSATGPCTAPSPSTPPTCPARRRPAGRSSSTSTACCGTSRPRTRAAATCSRTCP